jgi:hypothetical protein
MKDEFRKVRKLITVISNEGLTPVFSCSDSGRIITRRKIDNPYNEFHPAIIIGRDATCRIWVAHNHYSVKRPSFETLDDYLNGQKSYIDDRDVNFTTDQIVDRAIFEVLCGDTYHSSHYNGDTFVNNVVWQNFNVKKIASKKKRGQKNN